MAKGQHKLRNRNADYLRKKLDAIDGICCQQKIDGVEEVGQYVFPVSFEPAKFHNLTRPQFYKKLNDRDIPTADCYPPLHTAPCFRDVKGVKGIDYSRANWGKAKSDDKYFPVVTDIYSRSFELPHHILLARDKKKLDYVVQVIKDIQQGKS